MHKLWNFGKGALNVYFVHTLSRNFIGKGCIYSQKHTQARIVKWYWKEQGNSGFDILYVLNTGSLSTHASILTWTVLALFPATNFCLLSGAEQLHTAPFLCKHDRPLLLCKEMFLSAIAGNPLDKTAHSSFNFGLQSPGLQYPAILTLRMALLLSSSGTHLTWKRRHCVLRTLVATYGIVWSPKMHVKLKKK
jgi:hypothetical protein